MITDNFVTGVNYWASNAGMFMWRNFDEKVVDEDFARLKAIKLDVVRLFPLWPDFQPIKTMYACKGEIREYRHENEKLFEPNEFDYSGLSKEMLDRFSKVLDLAEKHGLKVCVGILTGWMSGRLFVPPALEGRNLLSDPVAVYYELRFVREFVKHFVNRDVIIAWTSGNETDCLANVEKYQYHNWSLNIYNAIRAIDTVRPVLEDMHPFRDEGSEKQYERHDMFEVTTVHPYAQFSPFVLNEPITSMRGLLHAVAEAKAVEGIVDKPCLIEEVGTLGDFVCSKEISGGFAKAQIMSAWANGLTGFMWWCANEQSNLKFTPYTWGAAEQELGLFNIDKTQKPVADSFKSCKENIQKTLDLLKLDTLPKAKEDAVCILNGKSFNWENNNDWRDALAAYVLSKQAGFNIRFCTTHNVPESDFYIIPSVEKPFYDEFYSEIMQKVANGATLYVSYQSGLMATDFPSHFGSEVVTIQNRGGSALINGKEYGAVTKLTLKPCGAEVLLTEEDGCPALTKFAYGKGTVYFCTVPMEKGYSEGFGKEDEKYRVPYDIIAENMPLALRRDNPTIGITEHISNENTSIIVAINYSALPQTSEYVLNDCNF